jgi:hypothetical protein
MNLLYFDPNPKSKVGKTSGTLDLVYGWTRMALIAILIFVDSKTASILNFILIGAILYLTIRRQPFYNAILNNLRVGTMFSAWMVSICSIGFAYSQPPKSVQPVYIGVTLLITAISIPAGFFGNRLLISNAIRVIYSRVSQEYRRKSIRRLSTIRNEVHVSNSHLDSIYSDLNRVVTVKAQIEASTLFWTPYWVEIGCRFIQTSYLDTKAVTFANDIFHYAMRQFPKDARVLNIILS